MNGKKPPKKRASSKGDAAANFNTQLGSKKGVKGSCEAGNLRACKSEVAKTPKFSAKGKQHNLSLVKSKKEKPSKPTKQQKQRAKQQRPSNPRFL